MSRPFAFFRPAVDFREPLRNHPYAISRRTIERAIAVAGRKAIAITDRQFAVLRVLWASGPLTVRELMEHLPRGDRQPYTTVLGLLQSMEKAGLVVHEKEGADPPLPARVSPA